MNDLYKECINTANYIADKITDKTGYKAALKKIKESSDPDDFYILYKMTINGQDYKLYAGEEDFTIAGEDNEIYIESDGFNTNRNIEYFCDRILDGVNEAMDFGKAKQILKENGFIIEGAYRDLIHQKIGEIRLNKKESESRVAQSKRKAAKVLRTVYKECKEFVDDLCNELVTDKIKLSKNTNDNYNKIIISTGTQLIGIIVKDDELVYIRDGYNEDNLSMDKVDKDSLSNFLNKVFDDITYYAAQAY